LQLLLLLLQQLHEETRRLHITSPASHTRIIEAFGHSRNLQTIGLILFTFFPGHGALFCKGLTQHHKLVERATKPGAAELLDYREA
jgi:hypothetical protein